MVQLGVRRESCHLGRARAQGMRNEVSQSFWQSAPILGVNAPGNCEGESVGAEFPVIFLFLSSVSGALPLEYLGILSKVCNFIESAPLTGQQVCTQIITKPDSSSSKLIPYTPSGLPSFLS